MQGAQALSTAGDAQQQNQQAQLNAAYQQWLMAQQYPLQMQGLLDNAVQLIPHTGTTTSRGSETSFGESASLDKPIGPIPGLSII